MEHDDLASNSAENRPRDAKRKAEASPEKKLSKYRVRSVTSTLNLHTDTSLDDSESSSSSSTILTETDVSLGEMAPTNDEERFTGSLILALQNETVKDLFQNMFQQCFETLTARVDSLEAAVTSKDKRIAKLEARVEEMEMREKQNNMRISGLDETSAGEEKTPQVIHTFIQDHLRVNLGPNDIAQAYRVGKQEDGKPRTVLVKFERETVKRKVYVARTKLKNTIYKNSVYFNEDLTQDKANLFYEARQLVRKKHFFQAWTFNGHVFAKCTVSGRPHKLTSVEQMKSLVPGETDK